MAQKMEEMEKEADQLLDSWLNYKIEWNKFLRDQTEKITKCNIKSISKYFDSFKYFKEEGSAMFPTIALLFRMEFARISNSGFQERVFSTAGMAMNENQSRMNYEVLEKRTLLCQNQALIKAGII